jgi:hypothetical protein
VNRPLLIKPVGALAAHVNANNPVLLTESKGRVTAVNGAIIGKSKGELSGVASVIGSEAKFEVTSQSAESWLVIE